MEKNLYETKKEISNQRGRIYLASLFFMFGGFYFVNVFIMHISVSIILINLFLSILSILSVISLNYKNIIAPKYTFCKSDYNSFIKKDDKKQPCRMSRAEIINQFKVFIKAKSVSL